MVSTKEKIKQVAIDLFYKKGYFATSISEIASGSGIQKAGIYYYFLNKEELLFNIMSTTMTDLMEHLQKNIKKFEDVEEKMRAAIRGHVQFHLNRQKENFIANSELRGLSSEHFQTIVKLRDAYEKIFQRIIRSGTKEAVFAKVDIKILSYAILTLCTSGAFWFNPDGRLSVDRIAEIYENFTLSGLKGKK